MRERGARSKLRVRDLIAAYRTAGVLWLELAVFGSTFARASIFPSLAVLLASAFSSALSRGHTPQYHRRPPR